jgi:two-component system NarL family sensor kinase
MDTKEARIYIAIIITVIVLGVIISFFAISIVRQQKRNLALQKANILAEISTMEKERSRIAADLHDELGPVLSVIKFQVDYAVLSEQVERKELGKASEQLDEMIERMREIANNLMPSALQRKGLIIALEEYISKVEGTGKLRIELEYPEQLELAEHKAIHVYRTIQEVIHNCVKHAKADKMYIRLERKNGYLTILCKDNGIGFDYPKLSKESEGIGLSSLKNRTEIMGGSLVVESRPGKGSAFLFEIPIK